LGFSGINFEARCFLVFHLRQTQMLEIIFTNQIAKEFLFVFCGVAKILFVFVLYGLALVFIGMNQ
jgi:hypothetical protein